MSVSLQILLVERLIGSVVINWYTNSFLFIPSLKNSRLSVTGTVLSVDAHEQWTAFPRGASAQDETEHSTTQNETRSSDS